MRFPRSLAIAATIVVATAVVASAAVPPTAFNLSIAASSGEGQPRGVLVADVSGDGKADLISVQVGLDSGAPASISLYIQGASGIPATPSRTLTGSSYVGDPELSTGDINGDGDIDLAVAFGQGVDVDGNPAANIDIFRGNPNGVLPLTPSQTISVSPMVLDATIADMNGDGLDDLFFVKGDTAPPYSFVMRAQKLDGTLAAATSVGTDDGYHIAAGDVNNDGLNDWVSGWWHPGDVAVHLQQPDHTFIAEGVAMPGTVNDAWLMDVNDDGREDLFTYDLVGTSVSYATRLAGGGFAAPVTLQTQIDSYNTWPGNWTVGDFNHDGREDLALLGWGTFQMRVFLQRAAGGLTDGCSFPAEQAGFEHQVSAGDLTGDGRDDIAMADNEGNNGSVWVNRQLQPPFSFPTTLTLSSETTAQAMTPITLQGELAAADGGCFTNDQIAILRTDASDITTQIGTATLGNATPTGVAYAFQDTPPAAGTYRYSATWAGDDTHTDATSNETSIEVTKLDSSVKFSVSDRRISYGKKVDLTATLTGGDGAREVTFYRSYNGVTTAMGTVPANAQDTATLTLSPAHTASYWAAYAGSGNYNPSTSQKIGVTVNVITTAKMVRYRRMDGSTALYGCCKAFIKYGVEPNQAGAHVAIKVWVYASGSWHLLGTLKGPLGSNSTGGGSFTIKNGKGYRFRDQVCFAGNKKNGGSCAPYLYFRFE